jgi:hypothetical protein
MVQRCTDPGHKNYAQYGGRGIAVCAAWLEYTRFLADMGEPPPGMSLDRIDPDGPYCKENCRWATHSEQMSNTRRTRLLSIGGRAQTASAWARELGINIGTLRSRLKSGWSTAMALSPNKFNSKGKVRHGV